MNRLEQHQARTRAARIRAVQAFVAGTRAEQVLLPDIPLGDSVA